MMFSRTVVEDQALRAIVEERVRQLWSYRQWFRSHRWADWPQERRDLDVELRALVRLARKARRLAAPLVVEADAARHEALLAEWRRVIEHPATATTLRWPLDAPEAELRVLGGNR